VVTVAYDKPQDLESAAAQDSSRRKSPLDLRTELVLIFVASVPIERIEDRRFMETFLIIFPRRDIPADHEVCLLKKNAPGLARLVAGPSIWNRRGEF
jgi:hypothetical protein